MNKDPSACPSAVLGRFLYQRVRLNKDVLRRPHFHRDDQLSLLPEL